MNKILIVGQAPPAVKQDVPYSTTMLYDWLKEIGISKEKSQEMFIFDAIYNKFPGFDTNKGSGHKTPTKEQMDSYWPILEQKIQEADKMWVLGNVAKNYIDSKEKTWSCALQILETMHPSKYNFKRYSDIKVNFVKKLNEFIKN